MVSSSAYLQTSMRAHTHAHAHTTVSLFLSMHWEYQTPNESIINYVNVWVEIIWWKQNVYLTTHTWFSMHDGGLCSVRVRIQQIFLAP